MKNIILIIFIVLSCAISQAQDEILPAVTVEGEEINQNKAAGTVEVIDVSDSDKRMTSLSEVLSERAGMQVKRYGGIGSRSTVSIRGSNANQVAVYLDGVPLADARSGEVNLEDIPLDNVKRIEVYRGFTPAQFSGSAMGGVVNIVTKKAAGHASTSGSSMYGSYDTWKADVSSSQVFEKGRYRLFFNASGSDGDFPYVNDNGTPVVNKSDDFRTTRKNNDHLSFNGSGSFGYRIGKLDLLFMNDTFYKDMGLPGMAGTVTENVRLGTIRNISSLKVAAPGIFSDRYEGRANIYYMLRRDTLEDPDSELGLGDEKQSGYFSSCGVDIYSDYIYFSPAQTVKLNLSVSRESYYHRDSGDDGEVKYPEQSRVKSSVVLEDELLLMDDRLIITPAARYEAWRDSFTDEGDFLSGTGERDTRLRGAPGWLLGLRYYPTQGKFYIRGSAGQSLRIPSFSELFGDRGYIIGNPELKHERSFNSEAGAGWSLEKKQGPLNRFFMEAVVFYNRVYDYIALIYNSQFTLKPQNIGEAEISGCEVSAALDAFHCLSVSANYTFQRALNKGSLPGYHNKYLPHRPVHEASGRIKFSAWIVSLTYELSYTGYNFLDPYNTEPYYIDYRVVHNCGVRAVPLEGMTITGEVKNFTDNRVSDVYNTPLPGRSFYLTLGYSW